MAIARRDQVAPATVSMPLGTGRLFEATGIYSDASTRDVTADVTWASDDENIATISNAVGNEGAATAIGEGTTVLRATLSGIVGQADVTVSAATLESVEVTPTLVLLPAGQSQAYVATGVYSDGSTVDVTTSVTWASTDLAVATISNAGGTDARNHGPDPTSE